MDMVLDEWIIHDLLGENGERRQQEAMEFLKTIRAKCDRIVVLQEGPWMNKAYGLMKRSDQPFRGMSRFLHGAILQDPRKAVRLMPQEIQDIPYEISVPEKDRYLVDTYFSARADVLVTTDEPLKEALSDTNVNVRLRDEFLKEYLERRLTHEPTSRRGD